MGKNGGEGEELRDRGLDKSGKPWAVGLSLLMVSVVGGLILTCWALKYHPTNRHLWMVPVGLISFATPILACMALFISDVLAPTTCTPDEQKEVEEEEEEEEAASSDLSSLKRPAPLPEARDDSKGVRGRSRFGTAEESQFTYTTGCGCS